MSDLPLILLQAGAVDPWIVGGIIGLLALWLIVGTATVKFVKQSSARYIIAGQSLPLFFVGTMLASQSIDGNASLGNAGLVFDFGFWAGASLPLGLATCLFIVAGYYGKKLNAMQLLTLPDFYYRRFGAAVEGVAGILMVVSFIILVAGNFAAVGFILSTVFNIGFVPGMLIGVAVVLTYASAGGIFSSAANDILQVYLAVIALWAAFLFLVFGFADHSFAEVIANAPDEFVDLGGLYRREDGALITWATILALGLGDVIALDFMERVFTAKSPKTARRGAAWGGTLSLLVVVPAAMLGIWGLTAVPDIDDSFFVLPELAVNHMPTLIGVALLGGVLGASMSTANGGIIAISSVISRNYLQRLVMRKMLNRPLMDDRRLLLTTRLMLIPIVGGAVILAWLLPQPGEFLVLAFDIMFAGAWAPLTFGLFWRKSNSAAAMSSLLVGSGLRLVGFFVTPEEWLGIETIIPAAVSVIVFVVVALATQERYPGATLHGVVDYRPPEEDVIAGFDLKDFEPAVPGRVPQKEADWAWIEKYEEDLRARLADEDDDAQP